MLGLQTLEYVMRTWDSIVSLLAKGGEAVWGGIDWSLEEEEDGYVCDYAKGMQKQRLLDVEVNRTAMECGHVWTEYDELSRDNILKATETKSYTAHTLLRLVHLVAPKMMHGVAESLDDPKCGHYKYWSNPLDTFDTPFEFAYDQIWRECV